MYTERTTTRTQLLSIGEVAGLCGVSRSTVRRLIRTHGLEAHRLGRQIRVELRDLDRFLDAARLIEPDDRTRKDRSR